MKRLIFILVFLITILFLLNTKILAQDEAEMSCGAPGQKCCTNIKLDQDNTKLKTQFPGIIGTIATVFMDWINSFGGAIGGAFQASLDILNVSLPTPECKSGARAVVSVEGCRCVGKDDYNTALLCTGIARKQEFKDCTDCSTHGVWTAIGCIDYRLDVFIKEKVFGWGVGLAGGVSLLCIIFAAFQLQTSAGNPEKIKKAQQLLTSCITGLVLIIFSVFILRLIGVTILKIPGFS